MLRPLAGLRPLAATRGVTLVVHGDAQATGARVRADAGRLSQVLSNLVGNAIKFSPAKGTVSVDWSATPAGLTVQVTDEGEGIAAHALPHLFSAYWQGDGFDGRGAGLGLWIARAIVEGHGGEIGVEWAPGSGATFRFTCPPTQRRGPDGGTRDDRTRTLACSRRRLERPHENGRVSPRRPG